MGFFRDISKLTKQAKEIDKTYSAKDQMASGLAKMQAANEMLANQAAALQAAQAVSAGTGTDGLMAEAEVVSVGTATGSINMQIVLPVEFLIMQEGLPPRPLKATLLVPPDQMHRLAAGNQLRLFLSRSNPNAVAVDWSTEY